MIKNNIKQSSALLNKCKKNTVGILAHVNGNGKYVKKKIVCNEMYLSWILYQQIWQILYQQTRQQIVMAIKDNEKRVFMFWTQFY